MSVKISFSFATYVKRLFYGHMFSVLLPEKLGNLDLQCRKKNRRFFSFYKFLPLFCKYPFHNLNHNPACVYITAITSMVMVSDRRVSRRGNKEINKITNNK